MPFTPFHFGPGAFVKSIIPRYFSFTLFALTQVFIDCETLYYILMNEMPLHRFFHTYIGANFVLILAVLMGRPISQWILKILNIQSKITLKCAIITGIIATYSHVFLDSIMHYDIKPFAPISASNPMLEIIDIGLLHLLCIACGFVGVMVFLIYYATQRERV
ncbi:MAG: DUF4184 domain-containing protein [Chlamydiota bacterium]|nr:DUF4184 domain-containing protein [Chlamydiota bacterium]